MDIALLLCGLAVGVLACTALAQRLDVPAPFLLIAVGVAASYVPAVPQVYLSHDVVLLGLLPPLLYAAAQQTSLVDFNANRRPILLLSVGLVAFTAAGVGVVAHLLLPGHLVGARAGPRCGGGAPGRGRGHRDRPPDRAAPARRHHPGGRVAAQRRHRAGHPEHGAGRRGRHRARRLRRRPGLRGRRRRRRPGRRRALRGRREGPAPPRRPPDRLGALAGGAVRGLRPGRGDPRLRGHRGGDRRSPAGPPGPGPAVRAVADRRAAQLAHDRVRAGEHGLPADRPPGLVDRPGRPRERPRRGPDRGGLRGHPRRGRRAAAAVGLPGALPAGAARPGLRLRGRGAVDLHLPARVGGHARRGDAGRGVRHPGGLAVPRDPAADGLHRRGRHPLRPGRHPADGRPPAAGARARTRPRTRWRARRCSSRPPRRRTPASRGSSTTTGTAPST